MEENKKPAEAEALEEVKPKKATDETETANEAVCEEITTDDTSPSEFMNIEHFADYRKVEDTPAKDTDEAVEEEAEQEPAAEATADDEVAEEVAEVVADEGEYREYENLTILDEIEEEPIETAEENERAESKDAEKYDEKSPRRVDARFDFIELFTTMMVVIMLLSAFVFRHSVVDGGSMENTLYDDEHLIISNFFYEPEQYDIIVCEDYTTGLKKPIIKRVIATEGQTVRVESMSEVYVDGELVDTSFIYIDGEEELAASMRYPIECVVPEGEVFVMGDHRNNSLDSRLLGTIDEDTILGKVVLRFYPFERFGKVE